MQKDFITATPDSGGSGSTTVTATAPANQTESARSTSLSVAGGGMTRTVGASQAAGVVTWNYYFSVTPTSLSFVVGGESKSVTVTSYRKKVINGVETSTQENVNYTVAVTGTGFSGSGSTVTAAANSSTLTRTGTATYTQATSGKSQRVSLAQAAAAISGTITFKSRLAIAHAWLFNSGSTPSGSSSTYKEMEKGVGTVPKPISWRNSLTVNNVSGAWQEANMSPGQTVYIRVSSSGSTAWGLTTLYSFVLQKGEQTVTIGNSGGPIV